LLWKTGSIAYGKPTTFGLMTATGQQAAVNALPSMQFDDDGSAEDYFSANPILDWDRVIEILPGGSFVYHRDV
jgi:hypothetical protein